MRLLLMLTGVSSIVGGLAVLSSESTLAATNVLVDAPRAGPWLDFALYLGLGLGLTYWGWSVKPAVIEPTLSEFLDAFTGRKTKSIQSDQEPAVFLAQALPKPSERAHQVVVLTALPVRWRVLLVAAVAGALAYFGSSDNRFTGLGVLAWAVAVVAGMLAFWDGPLAFNWRERWRALQHGEYSLRVPWQALALVGVLGVAAYFLFWRLDAIPPEMTSDHVEKLLDVRDVLEGARPIFFERNTGREPLQFYFAAWVARLFGTGLTHLTLKITSAAAGLFAIVFIYRLGRELEDETLGLLAALLASFSIWLVAISRVGLRFSLVPAFVAPTLYFLYRGLRTGRRNDFLWAGLALGGGLYGYSPFRVMPVVVAGLVAVVLLRPQEREARLHLLRNVACLSVVVLAAFAPLLRYANENPSMYWYRSLGRLTVDGQMVPDAWNVFWSNQWKALAMFHWRGDDVWANGLSGRPVLDPITGGLLILGVAFLLYRAVRTRSLRDGLTLLLVPVLILPSSLSLAFPGENPSVVRASGALVLVFMIAAQPLRLALQVVGHMASTGPSRANSAGQFDQAAARLGRLAGGLMVGSLLVVALRTNHRLYFQDYLTQYVGAAQNASEVGSVVRGFAESIGSYETVMIRAYPHWVDTRAVGFYAGRPGWDNVALDEGRLAALQSDSRPRLFILHRDDQATLAALRRMYPTGMASGYASARPHHAFLLYFVPGLAGLDVSAG